MGYRHTQEEILEGALAVAFSEGLSQLSFGRVAKQLGINDRTVVYYFATKEELVSAVLVALGERLQATLASAFDSPADDHVALARTAWPILTQPTAGPTFALYFEASGHAAVGREPYRTLVPLLVDAWIEWVSPFVRGTPRQRRIESEATIAIIDGLLLLRQVAGPDAAERAARVLGVAGPPRGQKSKR